MGKRWEDEIQRGDAVIRRRSYCFAVDETGNEEFKGTNYFGIAGICGFGSELMLADKRWRRMKCRSFGGEGTKIHMSGVKLTKSQLNDITHFFNITRIGRFAYLLRKPTATPFAMNAVEMLRSIISRDFANLIVNLPTLPDDIHIVIEKSDRLSPRIMAAIPGVLLEIDNRIIPVILTFCEKSPNHTILEMADSVAHRAQRQYRSPVDDEILPEFTSVFPDANTPYAQYREMAVSEFSWGSDPKTRMLLKDGKVRFRFEW